MGLGMFLRSVVKAFTGFRLDGNSGIVMLDAGMSRRRVMAIRLWNLIEPFAVFGAMMGVIWISMMQGDWWRPSLYAMMAWCFVVSPLVHYPFEKDLFLTPAQRKNWGLMFYFFECRGLGNPFRYYLPMNGESPYIKKYFKNVIGVTLFIDLLLLCALITFNKEVGERYAAYMGDSVVQGVLFRILLVAGIDVFLILVLYPVMLRLDNFADSLRFIVAFMILLAVLAFASNVMFQMNEGWLRERLADDPYMSLRGAPAAERLASLNVFAVGGQWSGYVFWGFFQEFLFLGVFSVQICRAFDVGRSKWHVALACLCTASLFGLVHIPNFWLSMVTFTGGLFGAFFFLQCRNLFAMGIVHGFGGTMFNKLLPINFSVGPSQVK